MRIKIEINTREHESLRGTQTIPFNVESKWFSGEASILTMHLEEMLATKMRALYQRSKGRDLFDLLYFYYNNPTLDWLSVVQCFEEIMKNSETPITRAVFEKNVYEKVKKRTYLADMDVLIAPWAPKYTEEHAMQVFQHISPLLSGKPWTELGV
jgi:predicted nucleotidyltransferase component of viral defense system